MMNDFFIDINCDVGEGIGNENELFPYISSCNIACGGHAGDAETMAQVVRLAKKYRLKIGAHPSYPDRKNFGRVSMNISKKELISSVREQIEQLVSILKKEHVILHHIKPHGALYNDIVKDSKLAEVFLHSIDNYRSDCILYVPYASSIAEKAIEQGFKIAYEAFGDRNYNDDLSLVSRGQPNALIERPKEVLEHIVYMTKNKKVRTVNDNTKEILADTYCVHGDTPSALQILAYLSTELSKHNIYIKK